ncbi:phenylalanine 4-monooxygenase [Wenxinia marina]|uniref:Phenylalanine-4-hydroxylase n=1 Tax=Wenxinia marina DSM 24838 TaxID=1123501 RepID=A0A0D0Q4Z3_9RHOB|nr:phenylalanine 4-monooxygenase [Wenxinia marina]KIQ67592.1 Phenylalanine 4-hydroxylase [Wenxinia marina DSM 24838]GGL68236.1 phenylalanine 4-monooxygenase [Wenxinia marina]
MAKDTAYRSKDAGPDGRYAYTPDEDAVWGELFDRQMTTLPGRMTPDYLDGVKKLGLTNARVPQVADIDPRLAALTGAGVEGVPAIIPPKQFFGLLAQRKFPIATFLRRREEMDYIEEPDLFHEVFGHCPLLTNRPYADFVERFGQTALSLPRGMNWQMFRLFWFTVEFGMIRTDEGLRAYGAGLASSPSELENAFSGRAEMRDFDLMEVLRTPYRIDIVQPVYFVIDSFEQLAGLLDADIAGAVARAKELGDLPPAFDPAA